MTSPQVEGELHVGVTGVGTTGQDVLLPLGLRMVDVPLAVQPEVVCLDLVRGVCDVHAGAVVGPGAELDRTGLVVEWEVADVYVTGCREHPSWLPVDSSIVVDQNTHLAEVRRQFICTETHRTRMHARVVYNATQYNKVKFIQE